MTLCPIALVSGCVKCPMFSVCPLKTVIGNYSPLDDDKTKPSFRVVEGERKHDHKEREQP